MSDTSSDPIEQLRNQVEENWSNNQGPCNRCPICDKNKGFRPGFGAFNSDADIMLVGHTPGETKYGDDNRRRTYVNHPDKSKRDSDTHNGLIDRDRYERLILQEEGDWNFFNGLRYLYGEEHNPASSGIHHTNRPTLTNPRAATYFTNFLKCSALSTDTADIPDGEIPHRKNGGYTACSRYFDREVQIVDPDVIAIFGKSTWRRFCDIYEITNSRAYDDWKGSGGAVVPAPNEGRVMEYTAEICGKQVLVVPLFHWANPHFFYSDFHWYKGDGHAEYYSVIAEELANRISEPSTVLEKNNHD